MEQVKNNTKKRTWQQLNEKERYKIEALFEQGLNPAQIGEQLHKSKRTIERERKLGLVQQKRIDLLRN